MFRERAKLFNRLQFIADLILTCAAFPLAYWSRIHLSVVLPAELDRFLFPLLLPFSQYLWIIALAVGFWAIAASSLGLYQISIRRSGWEKVRIVIESSMLLWLFLGFLSFASRLNLSRPVITLFAFYQGLFLSMARLLMLLQAKRENPVLSARHCRNILMI